MTSMRRRYVASKSFRRHVPAWNLPPPPLGPPKILNLAPPPPPPPNILNLPTPRKTYVMKYVVFMGTTNFLFSSVTRWCKKFKSGVDSVEDAPHARRPKTVTSQKIVEKLTNLVATDAIFTIRHIAKCVGISVAAAHTILRRNLKMRRISARWIPHLVTKEQKLARVRIAKQLLKQFPKYNNRSFANIITGDETWVHFYEPKRKIQNKIWATKGGKRPCIAKRTMSIKMVMYVIFFTNQGPAIQIAVP